MKNIQYFFLPCHCLQFKCLDVTGISVLYSQPATVILKFKHSVLLSQNILVGFIYKLISTLVKKKSRLIYLIVDINVMIDTMIRCKPLPSATGKPSPSHSQDKVAVKQSKSILTPAPQIEPSTLCTLHIDIPKSD